MSTASDIGGFNNAQVDTILDVIDECRHVSEAWDKCHNRNSLVLEEAMEELDHAYIHAGDLGVESEVLIRLICRNLPEPVLELMHQRKAA